jgi:hypothetical protein
MLQMGEDHVPAHGFQQKPPRHLFGRRRLHVPGHRDGDSDDDYDCDRKMTLLQCVIPCVAVVGCKPISKFPGTSFPLKRKGSRTGIFRSRAWLVRDIVARTLRKARFWRTRVGNFENWGCRNEFGGLHFLNASETPKSRPLGGEKMPFTQSWAFRRGRSARVTSGMIPPMALRAGDRPRLSSRWSPSHATVKPPGCVQEQARVSGRREKDRPFTVTFSE